MRCSASEFLFFSSRRRHRRYWRDWSSDVCSSDLPELVRYVREYERRLDTWGGGNGGSRRERDWHKPRYRPPARPDVIERLDRNGLLPAITFVFSRNGCDAAVDQCLRSGLRLTDEHERAEIAAIVDERTGSLPEEDLHVLGFWEWRGGRPAGLGAPPPRPGPGRPGTVAGRGRWGPG